MESGLSDSVGAGRKRVDGSLIRLPAIGSNECRRDGNRGACRQGAGGWGDKAKVSAVRHRSGGSCSFACTAVCIGHAVLTAVLVVWWRAW